MITRADRNASDSPVFPDHLSISQQGFARLTMYVCLEIPTLRVKVDSHKAKPNARVRQILQENN